MNKKVTYVLIHSPLVGPFTWQLVGDEIKKRGLEAVVPALKDQPNATQPYWQQHAVSVETAFNKIPTDREVVLVGHSGAGPILPAIRKAAKHAIAVYVFVDAGYPRDNFSRLDLMRRQDTEWAEQFFQEHKQGKRFPNWNDEDLRAIIPDNERRRKLIEEINPRTLEFFVERIPVFQEWPDAPCAYIKFTASYDWDAKQAAQHGWYVSELDVGHFHMLVDPLAVTEEIVMAVRELGISTSQD